MNPLQTLATLGQSVWLDYIRRHLITSGELAGLVREDGLAGVTSNPAIFERAIAGSSDYAEALARHVRAGVSTQGIAAVRQLIAEGISVNVTLLFTVSAYEAVLAAYVSGLEDRVAAGQDIGGVASVASFFVSRIDTAIDAALAARGADPNGPPDAARLAALQGAGAIANARRARRVYLRALETPRWRALADRGAQPQRLLWASTGTKNPAYRDTLYVEELIGSDTVNTIPPSTYDAFRDHGRPRASLDEAPGDAERIVREIEAAGISFDDVGARLLEDGLEQFREAFRKLLAAVAAHCEAAGRSGEDRTTWSVRPDAKAAIETELQRWHDEGLTRRLWSGDASLWTSGDEANWLGWLTIVDRQLDQLDHLRAIADDVRAAGFSHALLLGMGGSSLAPDVLRRTFDRVSGFPELVVLDSTDPAQIADVESRVDLTTTIVIVSSKSGSTLEPNILLDYFSERLAAAVGADEAPRRIIAVTDPGSSLARIAAERRFRHVGCGVPSIGGRYSALSDFGLVPAAVMGLDVADLVERAAAMVVRCAACVPAQDNPGVRLGVAIGTLAREGKDKLTLEQGGHAAAHRRAWPGGGVADHLRAHFGRLTAGDYVALLAYLPMHAEAFAHTELVSAIVSEEEDEPRQIACGAAASYVLCIDPLDGSSNSDVNGVVGTIFGIYRTGRPAGPASATKAVAGLSGTGRAQVAAGYIMYGPSAMFVYTTGDGVNGFTLDRDIGEFMLTHPDIRCPAEGRYYSVNAAAAHEWPAATQAYLASLGGEAGRARGYSHRYTGALVADVHRALVEGGTYFYPPDRAHPDGNCGCSTSARRWPWSSSRPAAARRRAIAACSTSRSRRFTRACRWPSAAARRSNVTRTS